MERFNKCSRNVQSMAQQSAQGRRAKVGAWLSASVMPHAGDELELPNRGTDIPNIAPVVHSDPDILGGTPVFVGTRVPFRNLIDYLERNHSLDEFLDSFPSVTREQAVASLEAAHEAVSALAHSD